MEADEAKAYLARPARSKLATLRRAAKVYGGAGGYTGWLKMRSRGDIVTVELEGVCTIDMRVVRVRPPTK